MRSIYIKALITLRNIYIFIISLSTYFLGGGIAHYIDANFQPFPFFLGLLWTICIILAGYFLKIYFSPSANYSEVDGLVEWIGKNKRYFLILSTSFLFVCGMVVVSQIILRTLSNIQIFLYSFSIICFVGFLIPPYKLSEKGYQEIFLSIYQAGLTTALGYYSVTHYYHNILLFISFPLMCIALASYIAFGFSTYAKDINFGRKTILTVISWQKAIFIHNILLIFAYIFFATGNIIHFPIKIIWPALLTFPLACLQVIWLIRIKNGGNPIWLFFNTLISSVYGLTVYFLAFTFWIN